MVGVFLQVGDIEGRLLFLQPKGSHTWFAPKLYQVPCVGILILTSQVVPTCFQASLCDRSWSTDDLEAEFSQLVLRCGFKPAWIVAVKTLQYLQELTRIQRGPQTKINEHVRRVMAVVRHG
jgi:hypothetical protein